MESRQPSDNQPQRYEVLREAYFDETLDEKPGELRWFRNAIRVMRDELPATVDESRSIHSPDETPVRDADIQSTDAPKFRFRVDAEDGSGAPIPHRSSPSENRLANPP